MSETTETLTRYKKIIGLKRKPYKLKVVGLYLKYHKRKDEMYYRCRARNLDGSAEWANFPYSDEGYKAAVEFITSRKVAFNSQESI